MNSAASRIGLVLLGLAGAYLLFCGLLFLVQRRLIYLPWRWSEQEARSANPGYEEVLIPTSDGERLHGWLRRREEAAWTVVVFHGNAGHLAVQEGLMEPFLALDLQVLLFDYRGYGRSSGRPSEKGLVRDGLAVAGYVEDVLRVPRDRTVYYGKSLGSGVAVLTAAEKPPARLILDSSYDSLVCVGKYHYPFLPVGLCLTDRFDAGSVIGAIDAPVLIIHARSDEVIPIGCGRALFARAREPRRFVELPGGHHNDPMAVLPAVYLSSIREFLARDGRTD